MLNPETMRDRLVDPDRRQGALILIGAWCVDTCVLFGCSAVTAHRVAATMVEGVGKAWSSRDFWEGMTRMEQESADAGGPPDDR